MYRVFLSYNTPDEMTVVWRLQTLAAASGLHLDVPNALQRSDWATVAKMIDEADSPLPISKIRGRNRLVVPPLLTDPRSPIPTVVALACPLSSLCCSPHPTTRLERSEQARPE